MRKNHRATHIKRYTRGNCQPLPTIHWQPSTQVGSHPLCSSLFHIHSVYSQFNKQTILCLLFLHPIFLWRNWTSLACVCVCVWAVNFYQFDRFPSKSQPQRFHRTPLLADKCAVLCFSIAREKYAHSACSRRAPGAKTSLKIYTDFPISFLIIEHTRYVEPLRAKRKADAEEENIQREL